MIVNKTSILIFLISFSLLFHPLYTTKTIPNFDFTSTSLDPAKTGFAISTNAATGGYFGISARSAGDIDKDGYDDIIIGAYSNNGDTGIVYVIYGGPSSSFSNIDLRNTPLNPATTGFTIKGAALEDQLGVSVSSAGDVDNDGFDDIIISAPKKNSYQGIVYVIYGGPRSSLSNIDLSTTTLNPSMTGFTLLGIPPGGVFGGSVDTAGDIDKDGYDDVIIGAYAQSSSQGAVFVIYGGPRSSLSNINLSTTSLNHLTTGFGILGEANLNYLGRWVGSAGDINGDGYGDIIFGAHGNLADKGAAYVIYGGPRSQLLDIYLSSTSLNPATTGLTFRGNVAGDWFGVSASTAGDINNDGYDDIVIGAFGKDSKRGAAYVFYGGPQSSLQDIDLSVTPFAAGFVMTGETAGDYFGFPVGAAGDINNDGYADIMIGANTRNSYQGAAYLVYGGPKSSLSDINLSTAPLDPASTGFTLKGSALGDQLGVSVSSAGDIDNDGFDDLIVGACGASGLLGTTYVINAKCPTAYCSSCISRVCQACDLGYGFSTNSLCESCPSNCKKCAFSSTCEECDPQYFLYQTWCLATCPIGTYSSNGKCQKCPLSCSSCTSEQSCQTCEQGYRLFNSLCIAPPSSEGKATQAVASGVQGISSAVTIGSAASPLTALVSKIVQNTRYLNLSVTDELAQVYQTWETELISWEVPNVITKFDHFKKSPELFARYDLDSSFLANFWATLMTLLVSVAAFLAFWGLKVLFERANSHNWLSFLVQKLVAGSFNFALVQAYGCFSDILFYLVLDFKTNPFNTFFCWSSFFSTVGFLALGCYLVFLNIWKVRQYQRIKLNTTDIEAFNERNKKWELFYSDFSDDDLFTQSTLALLVIRSSLSSIITTTLYDYPLMQTVFFVILDGAIMLFLYFKNPFATLRGRLAQYYFEAVTLLVHLCTFILALQDTFPSSSSWLRNVLSKGIIYLNTILISGSLGFLFIEIYKTISQKNRAAKLKKSVEKQEDTMEAQSILSQSPQTITIGAEIEIQTVNNIKQVISPENSHLYPQSANHLDSSMNTDTQQRGHSFLPLVRNQRRSRPQNTKPLRNLVLAQHHTRNLPKN